jgi:hypothetical protein
VTQAELHRAGASLEAAAHWLGDCRPASAAGAGRLAQGRRSGPCAAAAPSFAAGPDRPGSVDLVQPSWSSEGLGVAALPRRAVRDCAPPAAVGRARQLAGPQTLDLPDWQARLAFKR